MLYAYDATLRFVAVVDHPDNCPPMYECTPVEPPPTPWPDGYWPYFVGDNAWELVEVSTS